MARRLISLCHDRELWDSLANSVVRSATDSGTQVMTKPSYTRLSLAAQDALLSQVIARCSRSDGRRTAVVFDLDGTLFENRTRTAAIFQEFAVHLKERGVPEHEHLERALPTQLGYLVSESLVRLGVTRAELIAEVESFWRERFFADAYLRHDEALAGAVSFARACYEAGANLVYFTGRDLPKMALGSFASLRDAGFPIGVSGTELVLKPTFEMPDEAYKRGSAQELRRSGEPVAFFDNEPGNCNTFLELFPDATSVFIDTQHAPKAPLLLHGVHVLEDFRRAP